MNVTKTDIYIYIYIYKTTKPFTYIKQNKTTKINMNKIL